MKFIILAFVLPSTTNHAASLIPLRNGALYKHIPTGMIVRVRSHSIYKASVTHHSDVAVIVPRVTLKKATEGEVLDYLLGNK